MKDSLSQSLIYAERLSEKVRMVKADIKNAWAAEMQVRANLLVVEMIFFDLFV